MAQQEFVTIPSTGTEFRWDDELFQYVCNHSEAEIEKACCSTIGSSGYIECGCGGQDSVYCPAKDCTGIEDYEVDELIERLS